MKIVRLLGGLGNQMFQYAFYLSFHAKGFDSKIDITQLRRYGLHNQYELSDIFNLAPPLASYVEVCVLSWNRKSDYISSIYRRLLPRKDSEYIERNYYAFDEKVYKIEGDVYYQGYWQNEKYFLDIKELILAAFSFKKGLNEKNQMTFNHITNTNSVSIHVRRGDYVRHPSLGGICTLSYYHSAILKIKSLIENPIFYFFSDDIKWCKSNFKEPASFFIDWNKGKESYIDMQLMSHCKHNIIANSSFSWWGAWLNQNPQKTVICPSFWVKDVSSKEIVPANWLRI